MKSLIAEYNKLAAQLGVKPVNRFSDKKTAERRLAKLRAQMPVASWAERVGYGKTREDEAKHALNLTPKQRKAFHAAIVETYRKGGASAVMTKFEGVSPRILAGHIRIAKSKAA